MPLLLLLLSLFLLQPMAAQPVKVIFDTDMALDVDDVGALAILNHLADLRECEILAVGIRTPVTAYDGYFAAACASAINTYYGRPEIPVGGFRGPYLIPDAVSRYVEPVARSFKHPVPNGLETEEAFKLYRKVLAAFPDTSITFVVTGFLTNLEMLLDSGPDEYSPLNGYDLVLKKVRLVSCMGGNFAAENEEFNFNTYPRSTLFVLSNWPTPVVFGGYELGSRVYCGKALKEKFRIEENPVAMAWHHFNGGEQRESWDELSALFAVRGGAGYFTLSEPGKALFWMRGGKPVTGTAHSKNIWLPMASGKHRFLEAKMPFVKLGLELDKMLLALPQNQ